MAFNGTPTAQTEMSPEMKQMGEKFLRCRKCFFDGDIFEGANRVHGNKQWGKPVSGIPITVDGITVALAGICPSCHTLYGITRTEVGTKEAFSPSQIFYMLKSGLAKEIKFDYTKEDYDSARDGLRPAGYNPEPYNERCELV